MRFSRLVCACGVAGLLLAAAVAQEPPATDPPKSSPDSVPGTYRSFIVLDQRTDPKDPKGKRNVTGFQHDLVVSNELNPTVLVFARAAAEKADEPLAKLVSRLKELAATYEANDFGAALIFPILDKVYADDTKAKEKADALRRWAEQLGVGRVVIGLSEKESAQTKAWDLPETGVVVVFYARQRVVKRWTLAAADLTDEAIAGVVAEVTKTLKK